MRRPTWSCSSLPTDRRLPASHRALGPCAPGGDDLLLEPVVRVGLLVEGGDLHVAGRSVQADGFDECPVRLEPDSARAVVGGVVLQLAQEAAANAETSRLLGNPHAFDLGGLVAVEPQ